MSCTPKASFKNSRIYPRAATLSAVTSVVSVPAGGTVVIPANPNRTYLSLLNEDAASDIRYGYPGTVVPVSVNGFRISAGLGVDIESPEAVTIANASGAPINVSVDEGSG